MIRLTESDLHRIVKESVIRILNEVDGYEKTILKANNTLGNNTILGKLGMVFNPKKARQFDRIHDSAEERYHDAWSDELDNRDNFPSASDPYVTPSEDDIKRARKDYAIMHKYRVGRNGRRKYGLATWEK